MPILRGHHLICLHFFHGEGYDETFINNLKKIVGLAEQDIITISSGADDVCKECVYLKKGKCELSDNADKAIRKMDIKALTLLDHSDGDKVKWIEMKDNVSRIFPDWYFQYCKECEWKKACEKDDYFKQLLNQL